MKIKNKAEIDTFCWDHRNNGCAAIKGNPPDDAGLTYNIGWEDMVTGETILIEYEVSNE